LQSAQNFVHCDAGGHRNIKRFFLPAHGNRNHRITFLQNIQRYAFNFIAQN